MLDFNGNGIPHPAAISNPNWTFNLMDSNSKKCGFLDVFCKKRINNVNVISGRAETLAHSDLRESYDLVFARAFGKAAFGVGAASGFLKVGGLLIVPHGTSWNAEVERSKKAMTELRLILRQPRSSLVPGISFVSLEFEKISETPAKYPRAVGIPTKHPLDSSTTSLPG